MDDPLGGGGSHPNITHQNLCDTRICGTEVLACRMCSRLGILWLVVLVELGVALSVRYVRVDEQRVDGRVRAPPDSPKCSVRQGDVEIISNGMQKIRMLFYNGTSNASFNFTLEQSKQLMSRIDKKKPFVLYIHGYLEAPGNESVSTVVNAYRQRNADNIVVLDWSPYAFGSYLRVAPCVKDVSQWTARALEAMVSSGLSPDSIHVVGHSLGAHVAGFMGRYLRFTIPRVTGLDPANPLFYQLRADHIDGTSGRLVDVIHTDGGIYGAYARTGTVDFFANAGVRPQPGCSRFGIPLSPRALCSHWRSWRYYAESVVNNTTFPAVECDSYSAFVRGGCRNNRVIYFGYSLPRNTSGVFYFDTNKDSPFGRGINGLRFN